MPTMNTLYIIASIFGLFIILVIVVFFIIRSTRDDSDIKTDTTVKNVEVAIQKSKMPHDLESLKKIIRNKKSSAIQLSEALDLIIKYHGEIHPKLGIRAHPEFDNYMEIIIRLCRHPRADSKMVVKFDKELRAKNPDYEKDINDAITKGLNSRV